jgi:hypothetical protein
MNNSPTASTTADEAESATAKDADQDPQPSQPNTIVSPASLDSAIPLAIDIGWTMALLFGGLKQRDAPHDRLPTEHELPPDERIELEVERFNSLLVRLGKLLPNTPEKQQPGVLQVAQITGVVNAAASGRPNDSAVPTWRPDESSQKKLETTNLEILKWLACADRDLGLAYQLGRSLRDTASPPLRPAEGTDPVTVALKKQLSRGRVSKLQEWLSTLAPRLPADSAAIVSASIGRWCDLITTVLEPNTPGSLSRRSPPSSDVAGEMYVSLLPQGDSWLNLLVGAESSEGLLTPEGFVAAGEAALSRTARIIKKILLQYWFALLILLIVLAVVLFFSAQDLGGAGKVWTQIAAIVGALGVTAKGIGSTMAELSKDAEKPIFGLEKIDAMAWAVTTIPVGLKLNNQGVRVLRTSGIRPSGPLGRG